MKNYRTTQLIALAALSALLAGACAHQPVKVTAAPQPAAASPDLTNAAEPSVRGDDMRAIQELHAVHFNYDSAELTARARATLRSNFSWLSEHADTKAQVAGYCDQRGTEEYNLALGQRRAEAVRQYYVRLGAPGDRIATISYGKENLLCEEMTQSCWRENRRAETLVDIPAVTSASQTQ